jgi:hypothetical protein
MYPEGWEDAMSSVRFRWRSRLLIGLSAMAAAVPVGAVSVGVANADEAGTRPPGCSSHFKDRNIRVRTINKDSNMHEMSNPPVCSPHGPILGMVRDGTEFHVYYADPSDSNWCYGWSAYLNRRGYILCSDYS